MKRFFALSLFGTFCAGLLPLLAFSQETSAADLLFAEKCTMEEPKDCPVLESSDAEKVTFERDLRQGDKFSLFVLLQNGEEKNIVTVRSWLKYDPALLKAVRLSDEKSDFPLAAPDGNKIDEATGQIQIGRGAAGGGLNGSRLLVATVDFEVISPQKRNTEISFVNFQKDVLGETGVFTLNQETFQPENILEKTPKKLLFSVNGGGSSIPSGPKPDDGENGGKMPSDEQPSSERLARPQGLRIQAMEDQINLVWNLSKDSRVRGYYVYYSENSGIYIRRRDLGLTNHAEFEDLTKNHKYYFAITAYDSEGKESDYSDEVYATFGVPGSESHPYEMGGGKTAEVVPDASTDLNDSGPKETLLIAFGFLGIFFLGFAVIRLRLFQSFSRSLS